MIHHSDDLQSNICTPDRLTEFCVELTHLTVTMLSPTPQATDKKDIQKNTGGSAETVNPESPNAILAGFQWQECPTHNCYDEDCKDYAERVKSARTP